MLGFVAQEVELLGVVLKDVGADAKAFERSDGW